MVVVLEEWCILLSEILELGEDVEYFSPVWGYEIGVMPEHGDAAANQVGLVLWHFPIQHIDSVQVFKQDIGEVRSDVGWKTRYTYFVRQVDGG